MALKPPKLYPFPEATKQREEPWDVRDASSLGAELGSTGMGKMYVPLDDEIMARNVRRHEMMHAQISPVDKDIQKLAEKHGVSVKSLQHAEDARVAVKLYHTGLEELALGTHKHADVIKLATDIQTSLRDGKMSRKDASFVQACYGLSFLHTDQLKIFASHTSFSTEARDVVNSGLALKRNSTFNATVNLAKVLEELHEAALLEKKMEELGERSGEVGNAIESEMVARYEEMMAAKGRLGEEGKERMAEGYKFGSRPNSTLSKKTGRWGDMTIVEPPRLYNKDIAKKGRNVSSLRDMGAMLSMNNISRLKTDGIAFQGPPKRGNGVSILIDGSGSMRIVWGELYKVALEAPAATIAMYYGDNLKGELKILVKDHKIVHQNDARSRWGGNTVDGPALLWLCKQRKPRIWVSDGCCIGANGARTEALMEDIQNLKRVGGVIQINPEDDIDSHGRFRAEPVLEEVRKYLK